MNFKKIKDTVFSQYNFDAGNLNSVAAMLNKFAPNASDSVVKDIQDFLSSVDGNVKVINSDTALDKADFSKEVSEGYFLNFFKIN